MIVFDNAFLLSAAAAGRPLTRPRIGWQSYTFDLTDAAVTVSSEAAGFPKDAPLRPDTAEWWKPTALPATYVMDLGALRDVDYIGIAGHTLGSSGVSVMAETDVLPTPSFSLLLDDLGAGEVDLSLLRGVGSATFTRATIATTIGPTGLVLAVGSGVPRSYYDPATLAYGGYLAEGARTNLCLQSEDLSTTWTNTRSTETVNATVSPDGATTADKLVSDATAASSHYIRQAITWTAVAHTVSVFAKAGEKTWIGVLSNDGTTDRNAWFNLATGAVGTLNGVTATIQRFPNGWYRCSITLTPLAALGLIQFNIADGDSDDVFDGNSVDGIYIWGAQIEAASFASTYIPTTTAAVTRNADVLTYPVAGNVSVSAGTYYCEVTRFGGSATAGTFISADDGSTNNRAELGYQAAGAGANLAVSSGGVLQANPGAGAVDALLHKVAAYYVLNGVQLAFDGALGTLDSLATMPLSFTGLEVGCRAAGANPLFGTIKNIHIWTTQLTDAQLQTITSASTYAFDPPWQLFSTEFLPADDSPIMLLDDLRSARNIRLTLRGGAVMPKIAVIYVGVALVMEREIEAPYTPLNLSRQTVLHRSLSKGGQFLGQGMRRNGVTGSVRFQYLSPAWYRAEFDPFVKHARSRPYFFAWNAEDYPEEVAFVWTDKDIAPSYMGLKDMDDVNWMSVQWPMQGIGHE